MVGTLVNVGAVVIGALIGLLFQKGLPKRFEDVAIKGIGLAVVLIGLAGALKGEETILMILSMVIGGIVGEALRLDERLTRLGQRLEQRFDKGGGGQSTFAKGFVTASLVFCIGAMAIVGPLQSGLTGDNSMLFSKSMLDFICAIIFASALGVGVLFSAAAVFAYQMPIALLAGLVTPYLTDAVIREMTAVGSLIIFALGLNMLGVTKFKLFGYVPAIFVSIALTLAVEAFF